jgi:hypothetical protein
MFRVFLELTPADSKFEFRLDWTRFHSGFVWLIVFTGSGVRVQSNISPVRLLSPIAGFQWGSFCPLFRNHGRRSGGLLL